MEESQPIRVLLVEDDSNQAELTTRALGSLYSVECVGTLSQALVRIRERRFDVVILDLCLPDASGLDTFYRTFGSIVTETLIVVSGATLDPFSVDLMGRMASFLPKLAIHDLVAPFRDRVLEIHENTRATPLSELDGRRFHAALDATRATAESLWDMLKRLGVEDLV